MMSYDMCGRLSRYIINTSDVVLMKDMQNLAGYGGVVIGLLHCIIQYTTVLLLCNGAAGCIKSPTRE